MTTNEQKILEIIWNWGGEAAVDIIAREAGISIEYTRLLCENLVKENYIDFLHSKLCKIKSKGKIVVAEKSGQNFTPYRNGVFGAGPKKIVIPERPSRFGLGKDKRGRLTLNY